MSDYTPTTDEVRSAFANRAYTDAGVDEFLAQFDRWLEAHDREVAAKALEDAATKRWVCEVLSSGYHNGATCRPDDPHEYWGCSYRYEFSVPATRIEQGGGDDHEG